MSKRLGATDFTPFNDFFPFSQELDVGNPGPFHNLLSSSIADANLGNGCHFAGAIRKTPITFQLDRFPLNSFLFSRETRSTM